MAIINQRAAKVFTCHTGGHSFAPILHFQALGAAVRKLRVHTHNPGITSGVGWDMPYSLAGRTSEPEQARARLCFQYKSCQTYLVS